MRNLLDELHLSRIKSGELIHFLGNIYPDVRQISNTEVSYSACPEQSIVLRYDGDTLVAITSQSVTELDRVRDLILENVIHEHGVIIARRVLYSRVPIKKYWRFSERFQISPIPESAPHARAMIEPHPFILEYQVKKTPNKLLEIYRRVRTFEEITLLLNAVSRHRIWMPPKALEMKWFVVALNEQLQTFCGQEGYATNGLTADVHKFTDFAPESQMTLEDYNRYYTTPYFVGDEYSLPITIGSFFSKWDELCDSDQSKFLRSCRWFSHSFEVRNTFTSAAYIALINSIETLLPEVQGEKCPCCNRNKGPGPTKQFIDFLELHVPEDWELDKRTLYSLRSAITHGGKLFHFDVDTFNSMNPERFKQYFSMESMEKVVHVVLDRWITNAAQSAK